ncbi:hypothetical protein L208DRAFT_1382621 [Tricholoma matsutake]|nr:hypothetical protein L208DRAFT_1382621 [Tricholoma matsutake 945]
MLVVPDGPEVLDQEDYPDVPCWQEADWTAHCERQKDCGKTMPKLSFLTDEDGTLLTDSQIKKFMASAKIAWNELYHHRLDPTSWTKKTQQATSYFMQMMKLSFPEFCYCEEDWKIERFAIIKYPDWCRDMWDPGAQPSKQRIGDSKNMKDNWKQKQAKGETTVPPGAQVIDLDNDGSTSHMTTTSTIPPVVNPPDPSTLTELLPPPPPTMTHSGQSAAVMIPIAATLAQSSSAPSATPSLTPATPCSQTMTAGNFNAISSTIARPSTQFSQSLSSPLIMPSSPPFPHSSSSSTTLPTSPNWEPHSQECGNGNPTRPLPATIGQDKDVAVLRSASGSEGSHPWHQVNPLWGLIKISRASLTIQRPSFKVSFNPIITPSSGSTSTAQSSKARKLMVASSTVLSAQNLFTVDYLKDHSPTISEFKVVWDNISSDTKKALKKRKRQLVLPQPLQHEDSLIARRLWHITTVWTW